MTRSENTEQFGLHQSGSDKYPSGKQSRCAVDRTEFYPPLVITRRSPSLSPGRRLPHMFDA